MTLSAMIRCSVLVALFAAVLAEPKLSFRGSGQVKEEEVVKLLDMEEGHHTQLLSTLESELGQMYASLPKNEHGNIGHQTVRYALHRFFAKRHGWFIRGLEPGNATWTPQRLPNGELPAAWVKEWVPNLLQERVERLGHHGATLHDLAAMAAAIEDLASKEVEVRLMKVYEAHRMDPTQELSHYMADEVLSTFYITFLLANNFTANNTAHLMKKKTVFARKYRGYRPAHEWFTKVFKERIGTSDKVDFKAASQVATDIGMKYHTFNEKECNDLRSILRSLEGKKPGRVRLSVLYNMTRYTHWRFTEKPEYLKALGALDDSDPKALSMITANYVMARPNCLDSSNYYSLCCTNVCEDLMSHLEGRVGDSIAEPEKIAVLVGQLGSDTVEARGELPATLLRRLEEIATLHRGVVPLHGRLFAQWMHHAYPRECPFPHEAGSISPQTAEEWSASTGATEQTSEAERRETIDGDDLCTMSSEGKVDCGDEDGGELPWNPAEELLGGEFPSQQGRGAHVGKDSFHVGVLCFLLFVFIASLFARSLSNVYLFGGAASRRMTVSGTKNSVGLVAAVAMVLLVLAELGLLDHTVFFLALGMSVAFYLSSLLAKADKSKAANGKMVDL